MNAPLCSIIVLKNLVKYVKISQAPSAVSVKKDSLNYHKTNVCVGIYQKTNPAYHLINHTLYLSIISGNNGTSRIHDRVGDLFAIIVN